jgi:hypothetical protein
MPDNFWDAHDRFIKRNNRIARLTNWYVTRPMFWYYIIGTTAGIAFGYLLNSLT